MHHQQADWFAGLWQRFGYTDGVHLRRMHYEVYVQHDVLLPDGRPYENLKSCWDYLQDASRHARYLGRVSPDAFIDQRNPAPHVYVSHRELPEPEAWLDEPLLSIPTITTSLASNLHLRMPHVFIDGYTYDPADQPYHIEVFAEKSTMDDVLLPVGRGLGVNLVTSVGYQSITGAVRLLRRRVASGKPVRIFYVSDFDHAGWGMPTQVSRQLQFWLPHYLDEENADIKLIPLVLTREQVDAYRLPNEPGDGKPGNMIFEARQGRGVVELDALEALHPGELARIVREAIRPYVDHNLAARLAEAEDAARTDAEAMWEAAIAPQRATLNQVARDLAAILARYEQQLAPLSEALDAELAPHRAALEAVRHAVQVERERFAPNFPPRPEPERVWDDEDDWLYDSGRSYLDQLTSYKRRAGDAGEVAS